MKRHWGHTPSNAAPVLLVVVAQALHCVVLELIRLVGIKVERLLGQVNLVQLTQRLAGNDGRILAQVDVAMTQERGRMHA